MLRIDSQGILLYANAATRRLLGDWVLELGQAAPEELSDAVLGSLAGGTTIVVEVSHRDKVYSFSIAPVVEAGYANAYGLDITDRVRSEDELRRALFERETLIRELYHRTKNNMNVISSMIALRASHSDDEDTKQMADEIESKITTMSLVHQKLYESKNLSSIMLDDYIRDLVDLLKRGYRDGHLEIAVEFELSPVSIPIDIAVPCGLVLNELFMNTLKHAFPERQEGRVGFRLGFDADQNTIELVYFDDGVGVPDGFDFWEQPTLGLHTVILIVEHQLRGTIEFADAPGFMCTIRFSIPQHGTVGTKR